MGSKPRRNTKQATPVVGWREWVGLPGLGVEALKAKIDTGARSSSLHAYDLHVFRRGRRDWVRFTVHPYQRDVGKTIEAEAPLLERRWVRPSGGVEQFRPVIVTELEMLGARWPIELTLANRDMMGFRMLLGRQALRGRCIVDPSRSFLGGRSASGKRRTS